METLQDRLIKLRKLFHFTQEDLATKLNISDKVVSKWECGESTPQLEYITDLSKLYGVSTDYLIKGVASSEDNRIINRPPTGEEKADEFIQQCWNIVKSKKLEKFKDLLLPKKVFETQRQKFIGSFLRLEGGIFKCKDYYHWQNVVMPYLDLDKLLKLDNFDIYEKFKDYPSTYGELRYLAKQNNDTELLEKLPSNNLNDFYCDKPIKPYSYTAEQIQGLTDIRFYENMDTSNGTYKISCALEKLEPTNPNYWKIVEILINKGAKRSRVTGCDELRTYTEPDILFTQMLLHMAQEINNKEKK